MITTKLLISVLHLLDIPTLLRCTRVSQFLHTLIADSVALQYSIELFAANLVDGPPSAIIKSARLCTLRDHQRAWNDVKWSSIHDILLTEDEMSLELSAWELVGGIFAVAVGRHLRFIQLPSTLRAIPRLEWTIPDIGFTMKDFAMDRSQNLLVVIELPDPSALNKQLRFHLRCLDDGRPHPLAHNSTITYHPTTVDVLEAWHVVQIYTDYVAIMLQALITGINSEVIFWNWRTGEQKAVLHGPVQSLVFLTQDLVMCGMCRSSPGPPTVNILSLDVVDFTAAHTGPIDMTTSVHTFLLPPLSPAADEVEVDDPDIAIRTDYSPSYAPAAQHPRPFTTAPADRLVVVTIKSFQTGLSFALFVRTSTLLSLAPRGTVPWGAWGPAHTRVIPADLSDVWFCYVHGMRAVVPSPDTPNTMDLLDFNQRALKRSLHHRDPAMRVQRYLVGPTRVDDDEEVFESAVDTALPCRIQSFQTPGLAGREFMLTEDGLVLMQDDHKFKVFSF